MKSKNSNSNENIYEKDKPYKGTFGSQLEELYSENLAKEIEQELAQPVEEEESTEGEEGKKLEKIEPNAVGEPFSPLSVSQPNALSPVLPSLTGFPNERLSLLGEVIKKIYEDLRVRKELLEKSLKQIEEALLQFQFNLGLIWEKATLEEKHRLLTGMLHAVYVDLVASRSNYRYSPQSTVLPAV